MLQPQPLFNALATDSNRFGTEGRPPMVFLPRQLQTFMIYTITLNPAVDRELTVPSIEFDTVLRASELRVDVGGKGFNVSRMVQRLGGESVALGFVGGNAGRLLADGLHEHGVATDFVWVSEETRTNVSIVKAAGDHYLKVNEIGPNISPTEQERLIDKVLGLSKPDDWCVLCGSLPPNVPVSIYAKLITLLHQRQTRVVLDTSGAALRLGCAAAPFLVTPNYAEMAELTEQSEPARAAQSIRRMGPEHVIATLGRNGAMLAGDAGVQAVAAPTIDQRNVIGAGDALVGGVLYSLEQGLPLSEGLRWGVACGTVAASLEGTAFGDRTTVERLLSQLTSQTYHIEPELK